jgi:polysaccharide export outer membrane protein
MIAAPGGAQGRGVTLHPGDVIELKVHPEAVLSGPVPVDERGIATFPILGPRPVGGVAWSEVRDAVIAAYRRELRDPVITLTPLRRISVLGAVNKAGIFLVDPTLPLAGAIALAEGASEEGDLRRVRVLREGRTLVADVPVERLLIDADVRSGDQLFVERRGWWARHSGAVVGALISAVSIVVSVSAR